jgi:prepilin-type N-terminal cleavage/methylation domain-containing protein
MTPQRGFTLIELAIVLVIITILIGGLAVPLSAQIQARRIAETNKTLEEAREAIIGYAMTHTISNKCTCTYNGDGDLLPLSSTCTPLPAPTSWCPATGTPDQSSTKTYIRHYLPCPDTNGDGIEETRIVNKCPKRIGFLPWVTLGTGAQDAWGNRLRYSTHTDVSNDDVGIDSTLAPANGWNYVCSSQACTTYIAEKVPVVLVSLGPNGWGALNVNGNTLAAPTSADEQENKDDDNRFVSRFPSKPDDPSGEFDDLLTWISYSVLFPRVCPTGCPSP